MKIFILVSTVITLPCLADITTVTFDHQKPSDKDAIAFVDAKKGEYIEVRIVNSCAAFTESFEGVKKNYLFDLWWSARCQRCHL